MTIYLEKKKIQLKSVVAASEEEGEQEQEESVNGGEGEGEGACFTVDINPETKPDIGLMDRNLMASQITDSIDGDVIHHIILKLQKRCTY